MSLVPRADPEFDDWEPLWPLEPEPTDWWEPLEPLEPVPTGWHSTQWRNGQWQPVWNPPFVCTPPPTKPRALNSTDLPLAPDPAAPSTGTVSPTSSPTAKVHGHHRRHRYRYRCYDAAPEYA